MMERPAAATKGGLLNIDSNLLRDVEVSLEVKLGEVALPIGDILQLQSGSVVKLRSTLNEPVEIFLNGALVARGEIVAIDDHFAVRILEVARG
jgi:flagellar motor switch protein FliN/FliY